MPLRKFDRVNKKKSFQLETSLTMFAGGGPINQSSPAFQEKFSSSCEIKQVANNQLLKQSLQTEKQGGNFRAYLCSYTWNGEARSLISSPPGLPLDSISQQKKSAINQIRQVFLYLGLRLPAEATISLSSLLPQIFHTIDIQEPSLLTINKSICVFYGSAAFQQKLKAPRTVGFTTNQSKH